MALNKEEIRTDVELRLDRFNSDDIKEFRKAEETYFKLVDELAKAEQAKDYDKVLELEDRVAAYEVRLRYQGKDTREVPLAVFKQMLHEGEYGSSDLRVAFKKIKNPSTALRAFCVYCMGGQAAEVKRCQSVTCPLWPFRLGQNPFFGKKLPPVNEDIVIEDSEDVAVEDDTTEGEQDAD